MRSQGQDQQERVRRTSTEVDVLWGTGRASTVVQYRKFPFPSRLPDFASSRLQPSSPSTPPQCKLLKHISSHASRPAPRRDGGLVTPSLSFKLLYCTYFLRISKFHNHQFFPWCSAIARYHWPPRPPPLLRSSPSVLISFELQTTTDSDKSMEIGEKNPEIRREPNSCNASAEYAV